VLPFEKFQPRLPIVEFWEEKKEGGRKGVEIVGCGWGRMGEEKEIFRGREERGKSWFREMLPFHKFRLRPATRIWGEERRGNGRGKQRCGSKGVGMAGAPMFQLDAAI